MGIYEKHTVIKGRSKRSKPFATLPEAKHVRVDECSGFLTGTLNSAAKLKGLADLKAYVAKSANTNLQLVPMYKDDVVGLTFANQDGDLFDEAQAEALDASMKEGQIFVSEYEQVMMPFLDTGTAPSIEILPDKDGKKLSVSCEDEKTIKLSKSAADFIAQKSNMNLSSFSAEQGQGGSPGKITSKVLHSEKSFDEVLEGRIVAIELEKETAVIKVGRQRISFAYEPKHAAELKRALAPELVRLEMKVTNRISGNLSPLAPIRHLKEIVESSQNSLQFGDVGK